MAYREYPPDSVAPDSPMTTEYRTTLLRLLADQARAEGWAAHTYASWIRRAPSPEEKMHMAEIACEETEHWYKTILLLRELGVDSQAAKVHESRHWFYGIVQFLTPRSNWLDVLMLTFLIDRGAYFLIEDFTESSYAPWRQVAREILSGEEGHVDFGAKRLRDWIEKRDKANVQRALNKWWRVGLNMFGPPRTKNTDLYIRLGLKFRSNEERRQAFRAACEPEIRALGLQVPRLLRNSYPFF